MKGIVLITGASSGFGESCARRFQREGWRLVLVARRMDRLKKLQKELGGPSQVYIRKLDVRDRQAVESLVNQLPDGFREIDVLVNNAGLALGLDPAHQANLDDWEVMIDTNIKGLVYFTRLILPGMVSRNRGHVVNIGSVAGNWPYPGGNAYGASKAFVNLFSRNLRADLVGSAVRISSVEPGLAETEFSLVRFKGNQPRADKVYQGTQPLTGDDIADIVYWTVSLPAHVNINSVEIMPTCQTWGNFVVDRKE